jgi:hypothetical protein
MIVHLFSGKRFHYAGQFDDFDFARVFVPFVAPTHNNVATVCRTSVLPEILAFETWKTWETWGQEREKQMTRSCPEFPWVLLPVSRLT